MEFRTVRKPIPRATDNSWKIAQIFSRCLNVSVFGVILATRYIPQIVFNFVMVLATIGAVFFTRSYTNTSEKKPASKGPKKPSWFSNVGRAIQNSALLLVCISLISITFYILVTSFWYNLVYGASLSSVFLAMFAVLCILLAILSISFKNLMSNVLPYINILAVLFFTVMLVLFRNLGPASPIYVPISAITVISGASLVLPGFAVVSHQYTAFSKALGKKEDRFCMTIGIVLSGVFYIFLGNLMYYFEEISGLLLRLVSAHLSFQNSLIHLGYNSWYGMMLRVLIALLCLVNFLANYEDLNKKLFESKKSEGPGIAYGTIVFTLAYYIVIFILSYFNGVSFQMIALYIPLYFLYSVVFYLYPLVAAISRKVGWVCAILLMMLMALALSLITYTVLTNVTLYQLVAFLPSLWMKLLQTS